MAKTYSLDQNLVNFLEANESYYRGRGGEGWLKIAEEYRIGKEWVKARIMGEQVGMMPGVVVTLTSEQMPGWGTYGT